MTRPTIFNGVGTVAIALLSAAVGYIRYFLLPFRSVTGCIHEQFSYRRSFSPPNSLLFFLNDESIGWVPNVCGIWDDNETRNSTRTVVHMIERQPKKILNVLLYSHCNCSFRENLIDTQNKTIFTRFRHSPEFDWRFNLRAEKLRSIWPVVYTQVCVCSLVIK